MTIDQKAEISNNKNELMDRAAHMALKGKATAYQKDRARSINSLLKLVTDETDTLIAGWLFCANVSLKEIESTFGSDVARIVVQANGPLDRATVEPRKIRLAEFYQSIKEDNYLGKGINRKKLLKKFAFPKNELYYAVKQELAK